MKKFVFTIALCAGLAVSAFGGFTKAVTFTATGYQGSATLENFPVLVKLPGAIEGFDYSDFGTETNLVFRDAGGNPLPHEIDTWDTSGTSLIWVRVPSLTATTSFTMFFCGSEAVANDSASTWTGANYVGVWHMDEADGNVADATGHGLAATPSGVENVGEVSIRYTGADAPIGHARQTGTASTRGYLSVPSYDSFNVGDTFTMSGWVRLAGRVGSTRLFSRKTGYKTTDGWEIEMGNGSDTAFQARGAARDQNACAGSFSPGLQGRWTHIALVYDGTSCSVYSNGHELVAGTITPATDNNLPLSIGCDSDGDEAYVRGAFDECRLLGAAASADWIAAEYATVADDAFVSAGTVKESGPPTPEVPFDFTRKVTFTVNYDGADGVSAVPVPIRLSAGSPEGFSYRECAPDGSDIRFADATGKAIPFEVDTWDPSGESLIWVKAPAVTRGTTFSMFYKGSSGVLNDPHAVWSDYTGVWHLNRLGADATPFSQGVYSNSTATVGIDGHLSTNSIPGEAGRFGKAFKVNDSPGWKQGNFNEGGVWVEDAGENSPLDPAGVFTISGWFKHEDWNFNYGHIFFKRLKPDNTDTPDGSFAIQLGSNSWDNHIDARGSSSTRVRATTEFSLKNVWVYLSFVYNGKHCTIYVNGAPANSYAYMTAVTDNDAPLVFGNNVAIANGQTGDCAWSGLIDEVRYLDVAKSADWIAAEYAAMADDADEPFLTAGPVEKIGNKRTLIFLQ